MRLVLADIISDLAVIKAQGDSVRGIELGMAAWRDIFDSLNGNQKMTAKGEYFLGYPFRTVESLGTSVNYLLDCHPHDPPWVSRDELE